MRKTLLALMLVALVGCATTTYREERIDADGSSYTYLYKATDANPLGKTETAAKDFSYEVDTEGASKVSTGQTFQGMDNTAANAVLGALVDALVKMAEINAAKPPTPQPSLSLDALLPPGGE